ncbi:cellular tumor antigen p53-like isoform X3 [Macrobrachium rosenbergii]|uniref:cellular tumor antigen p53-like isoform X3 n=1 Tax=Macrobrachium rosenbergii TaxID=79674 RepID=UPI0034D560A3
MEKEEQLLSDDIYDMIDQDLSQGINGNFESLVESPHPAEQRVFTSLVESPHPAEQRVLTNHSQHAYQYNQGTSIYVGGQQPGIQYPNQLEREHLVEQGFDGHHAQQRREEQQSVQNYQDGQPFQTMPWDSVTEMPSDVGRPGFVGDSSLPELTAPPTVAPVLPFGVPSLQPWTGQFNFTASITTDNKDKNKWCYSQTMNKLYVVSQIAVPLSISVNPSVEGTVTFTPVFKQSQHMKDPVLRCYNCKSQNAGEGQVADHIVQIESSHCQYRTLPDERRVVTVPLPQPPPGENYSTILFKITCLTSCIGGPNRRPFCLVLTLHCSKTGRVIGRQIVDIKCCKCPYRDMANDEKQVVKTTNSDSSNNTVNTQNLDEGTGQRVRKLASQIKVGQKRKRPTRMYEVEIVERTEPRVQSGFVNISVPVEFEAEVKRFVNGLMATRHLRRNCPDLLLYPEADSDTTDNPMMKNCSLILGE